jgi:hypothetical protein
MGPWAGAPPARGAGDERGAVAVHRAGAEAPAPPPRGDVPRLDIEMPDRLAIAAEFFRWEFATAAAGALMGVNPFDEPNVTQAKEATRRLLDGYAAQKQLRRPESHASLQGARMTLSRAAVDQLDGDAASAFLRLLRPRDYFGLLAFLPPDDHACAAVLDRFRLAVGAGSGCATMGGYGPRYLHSTGQLHKGGGDNGVFIIISADGVDDIAVPGEAYSFLILELAQAIGDFQSLEHAGRRALHLHLPRREPELLQEITDRLLAAAELDTK